MSLLVGYNSIQNVDYGRSYERTYSDVREENFLKARRPLTWKEKVSLFFHGEQIPTYEPPKPIPGKKTLILDLDETLIHSSDFDPHPSINSFKHLDQILNVMKRPGLDEFLLFCRENFDVFIFTAGSKEYADYVIDNIAIWIPDDHRFYKDSCTPGNKGPVKNVKFLGRPPSQFLFLDDSTATFEANPKNTLRISKWNGCPTDDILLKVAKPILEECINSKDVREIIASHKADFKD